MTDIDSAGLFHRIRERCKAVAEEASFVRIRHDRIASYAASLPLDRATNAELDPKCHYLGHGEGTTAFIVTLDTINFGSGFFPYLRKRPGMSGYFTVATSLKEFYDREGPLSAGRLSVITALECAEMLGQDLTALPVQELMGLFAKALKDLGRLLVDSFQGSFAALVESAGHSAEELVILLSRMPFFNDVEMYGEMEVPFFKRAQICAADLALAFDGKGPGRFDDLHGLTMFADNLVPHVLRLDGILEYRQSLAARIDREEPIPAGAPEEVEIRACAVHTVELLSEALLGKGEHATSMGLDSILWNRGQEPFYKKSKPRHRTRTVFY